MNETKLFEFLENNLQRQLESIRAADAKIPHLIAIDTFMLGTLAIFTNLVKNVNSIILFWEIIAGILLLASLITVFFAVFPRTSGPKGSIIYFGGIIEQDSNNYLKKISALQDNDYLTDLSNQTHRNAQIASEKYKFIKYSLLLLLYSILPWLISILLLKQWSLVCY